MDCPPNSYLVATSREGDDYLCIIRRVPEDITKKDAIGLAAWLAVMADPMGDDFAAALEAVRNS